jgi:signal peptidase I
MERILGRATGIVRRILDALLLALIVVVLGGVVLAKLVPLTGRQTIAIGGGSMEPAVPLGAAVIIEPVEAGALRVGDIVSLKAGPQNALYTHRIVAVVDRPDGRWVQTKGDANADADPSLVHASAIVGRTEMVIPLAGYLIVLLSIPAGVLFLIGLAASLLAGAWLLESLEPEWVVKGPARPVWAVRPSVGEPIAARLVTPKPSNDPAGVGLLPRRTVSEHLALSRETRVRRARWASAFPRRGDRPLP